MDENNKNNENSKNNNSNKSDENNKDIADLYMGTMENVACSHEFHFNNLIILFVLLSVTSAYMPEYFGFIFGVFILYYLYLLCCSKNGRYVAIMLLPFVIILLAITI